MSLSSQEIFDLFMSRRTVLSPLRYPGGKRRLAPYVAAALAENDLRPDLFVEPYAGGAARPSPQTTSTSARSKP